LRDQAAPGRKPGSLRPEQQAREITVAVTADGKVANYTTTTFVGFTLKDSVKETQSATNIWPTEGGLHWAS
jgi:hypothetical protein